MGSTIAGGSRVMKDVILDWKRVLRSIPSVYCSYCFLSSKKRELVVTRKTELVIEGYPRCANTFAVIAFILAQSRRYRIGHHLHAPAQVIRGVKYGIPVLLLIRNPVDAVCSLVIRNPKKNIKEALLDYIFFYKSVEHLVSDIVVADFDAVVSDYGSVIGELNQKYSRNFTIFKHDEVSVQRVFKEIDYYHKLFRQGDEKALSRPSPKKNEVKSKCLEDIHGDQYSDMLHQANSLYQHILSV